MTPLFSIFILVYLSKSKLDQDSLVKYENMTFVVNGNDHLVDNASTNMLV